MHILLVHQSLATLEEAGGTRHYELAQYLAQQGHRITIIASPISYLSGKSRRRRMAWIERETPVGGITILRTYTYPALHKSFFHRLLSFLSFMVSSFWAGLRIHKVDLVWGTSPPIFQALSAYLLARLKGACFLMEVRDLWPAFAIAMGVVKNPVLIRVSLALEGFLYRHADQVMVNSPGFIDHVKSRGVESVELIPNGADPAMFQPHPGVERFRAEHFRDTYHLQDHFVVVYAGAHGISNDLDVVLDAADLLCENKNIQFVFVGDGKDKPRLMERAKKLNLKNVLFLPPVAKNDMQEVLAASNACLAILKPIELYKTTYPNKVFDYMAAGRPVILAIDGVIRTVVESAQAGIFTPPGDAPALAHCIADLASHPERAYQMGISGSNAVQNHFNRARLAEQLSALLEKMVSGRS